MGMNSGMGSFLRTTLEMILAYDMNGNYVWHGRYIVYKKSSQGHFNIIHSSQWNKTAFLQDFGATKERKQRTTRPQVQTNTRAIKQQDETTYSTIEKGYSTTYIGIRDTLELYENELGMGGEYCTKYCSPGLQQAWTKKWATFWIYF